jgi:hypothetical protein
LRQVDAQLGIHLAHCLINDQHMRAVRNSICRRAELSDMQSFLRVLSFDHPRARIVS